MSMQEREYFTRHRSKVHQSETPVGFFVAESGGLCLGTARGNFGLETAGERDRESS